MKAKEVTIAHSVKEMCFYKASMFIIHLSVYLNRASNICDISFHALACLLGQTLLTC